MSLWISCCQSGTRSSSTRWSRACGCSRTPLEGVVGPGVAGGLAIILFTILLRLVLVPLSLVQIRSQRAPDGHPARAQGAAAKFKGDREGMARAQMQLYKERGINPAAGCVPLLIQMPILFGMYAAMSQLATQGLTLDQVTLNQNPAWPGRATRPSGTRTRCRSTSSC